MKGQCYEQFCSCPVSKWQIEVLTDEITCPRSPKQSVEELEISGTVFVNPNVKSSFLLLSVHSVFMNIAVYLQNWS